MKRTKLIGTDHPCFYICQIDLEPANIQRAISHIPSLKPDELREKRRIFLESEMTKARLQLEQLAANKTSLEAAISKAEVEAARPPAEKTQSEAPPPAESQNPEKDVAQSESEPAAVESAKPAPAAQKKLRKSARPISRAKPGKNVQRN